MHVEVVTCRSRLEEFRFLWHALWLRTRGRTTCQSFRWYDRWSEDDGGRHVAVVAVWEGHRLLGVVPMARHERRRRRTTWRIWSFPTQGFIPAMGRVGPEPTRLWIAVARWWSQMAGPWDFLDLTGCAAPAAARLATVARLRRLPLRSRRAAGWRCEPRGQERHAAPWPLPTRRPSEKGDPLALTWEVAKALGTACTTVVHGSRTRLRVRFLQEAESWILLDAEPLEGKGGPQTRWPTVDANVFWTTVRRAGFELPSEVWRPVPDGRAGDLRHVTVRSCRRPRLAWLWGTA